ncbi:39S ribosomal protein L21, partial [Lamprotornis superbus]
LVAKTSLTSPPWPEVKLPDPVEEAKYHAEVVQKVNGLISAGHYGRLFAVVHFASKQWKITNEDLIMMDNVLEAECGDRIRMEKVLLVGADDFTLIGRPLLGKDLVRVEATVIEKTESWPKVNMRFWRRHNYQRKRSATVVALAAFRLQLEKDPGEGSKLALQPLETAGSAEVHSALPISDPLAQTALGNAALSLLLRLSTQVLAANGTWKAGTAWIVASSKWKGWGGPSKNHLPPLPLLPQY